MLIDLNFWLCLGGELCISGTSLDLFKDFKEIGGFMTIIVLCWWPVTSNSCTDLAQSLLHILLLFILGVLSHHYCTSPIFFPLNNCWVQLWYPQFSEAAMPSVQYREKIASFSSHVCDKRKGWLNFAIAEFLLDEMLVILKAVIILGFSPISSFFG